MKQNAKIVSLIFFAILTACTSITKDNPGNSQVSANGTANSSVTTSAERATPNNSGEETLDKENAKEDSAKEKSPTYDLPTEISEAQMKTLDGRGVKLSDYKGKVVLVNMWATWCGPCRSEIPELVRLSEELKDQDVKIVGLTIEDSRGNTPRAVHAFVEEQKIPYDVVWSTDDVWEELITLTPRPSIPQSFVMNRAGQLTAIFVGYNPVRTPASVRKAVDEALKSES